MNRWQSTGPDDPRNGPRGVVCGAVAGVALWAALVAVCWVTLQVI